MHDKPGWQRFDLGLNVAEARAKLHQLSLDGWTVVSVQETASGIIAWANQGY